MLRQFRPLMNFFRVVQFNIKFRAIPHYQSRYSPFVSPLSSLPDVEFRGLPSNAGEQPMPVTETAIKIHTLLRNFSKSSNEELTKALDNCELSLTEDLVLDVLRRNHSDYVSAFQFFKWVSRVTDLSGYTPSSEAYNEMLGILGKAKQFDYIVQMFDEMFKRGIMNEKSYDIVFHRYAAAHMVDEAIEFFCKRKQYGLDLDLPAFQSLLMALCRYKHVETAESLFHSGKGELQYNIKTWNIILNGWCLLRNLHETKRFWKELKQSKCQPDKYSYATYINSLCKSGKISSAVKLFNSMKNYRCKPDVVICNSVIDGLCFKKRVPEALEIFRKMEENGCQPSVATYNCLIKCMCKIERIEMALKLLSEMEEKAGDCAPNDTTYAHLLTVARKPKEVKSLLARMRRQECKITSDVYNLVLRLYMGWRCDDLPRKIWGDMLRDGVGPDQRSYTIMIHEKYEQGKFEDALYYFDEMTLKKMTPGPKTLLLVDEMRSKVARKLSTCTQVKESD